jgi:hypothetical protein
MTPRILAIRPAPSGAGGRTIAFFDVQLTSDCRLFNLKLVDGPAGRRVHAPSAFGSNVATFTPHLAAELVRLASIAFGDIAPNDRDSRTAA